MGIFKQMKDLKDMVAAAPGMVDQAQQMAAQAQQMAHQMSAENAAVAQATASQAGAAAQSAGQTGALEPIAGVDLALYATIVKAIAPLGYDQSKLPEIAQTHGIDATSWQLAHDGWNARIQSEPAVARAFSDVYTAA
jgi:cell division septum initiation protein DivIVA